MIFIRIIMIFLLPFRKILVWSIRIYGVPILQIPKSLKLFHVLNTQMGPNSHHTFGFFKVFVGSLIHKFVFFLMLARNPLPKESSKFYKLLGMKMLEGWLDLCQLIQILSLKKGKKKKVQIVLKTVFFQWRKLNNLSTLFLTSLIKDLKVL